MWGKLLSTSLFGASGLYLTTVAGAFGKEQITLVDTIEGDTPTKLHINIEVKNQCPVFHVAQCNTMKYTTKGELLGGHDKRTTFWHLKPLEITHKPLEGEITVYTSEPKNILRMLGF